MDRDTHDPLRHMALAGLIFLVAALAAVTASASGERGPETGLPLPRFVSMKAAEANVRRGPSLTHRVDWVFRHQGMPLIVTAEYGHWRRVVDRDGVGGWIHYAMLSGVRSVIVDTDMTDLRRTPSADAPPRARAERGVIARLEDCADGWCSIRAGGRSGWVPEGDLWGVTIERVATAATAAVE